MNNNTQAKSDAVKFLKSNVIAVVATSFNDEPRASVVYYYMDDYFNFYFVTKRNTAKYMNAELNPKAAIVIGTGPEHITVQAHGNVELIVDDAERDALVEKFLELGAQEQIKTWPIEEMQVFKDRHKVVFRIVPDHIVFMNMDSKDYPNSVSDEYVEVYSAK